MNEQLVLDRLQMFPPSQGALPTLPAGLRHGLSMLMGNAGLITMRDTGGNNYVAVPVGGVRNVTNKSTGSRLCVIGKGNATIVNELRKALQGGESHPYLSPMIDIAFGITLSVIAPELIIAAGVAEEYVTAVSTAAGAAWSYGRVAMSDYLSHTGKALPREDDRLIAVQRFGKMRIHNVFTADETVPAYSLAYLLVDPFRMKAKCHKHGWVLHEERYPISLT